MGEPTYEEIKRDARTSASVSIEKNQQQKRDMLAAEAAQVDLAPSLIYRQLRDLKTTVADGDALISDLFDKFDAVLGADTTPTSEDSPADSPVRVNSDLYSAIGYLEQHVHKQHARLRTLMERCEL